MNREDLLAEVQAAATVRVPMAVVRHRARVYERRKRWNRVFKWFCRLMGS